MTERAVLLGAWGCGELRGQRHCGVEKRQGDRIERAIEHATIYAVAAFDERRGLKEQRIHAEGRSDDDRAKRVYGILASVCGFEGFRETGCRVRWLLHRG